MRLELALAPGVLSFTLAADGGPLPWLLDVGTLLLQARAGHLSGIGIRESSSLPVTLDNTGRQASRVIGRPLRAKATVYDGAEVYFAGIVASIAYASIIQMTLEA